MAFHLVAALIIAAAPNTSAADNRAPYAYLIPGGEKRLVAALHERHAELQVLREDIELDVLTPRIEKAPRDGAAVKADNGDTIRLQLPADGKTTARRFLAGTVLLRARGKQNLAAAALFDPAPSECLPNSKLFAEQLKPGDEFPVSRLMSPVALLLAPLPKPAEKPRPKKPIRLQKRPNLSGAPTHVVTWLDDGQHFLQFRQGQLHKVHARSGRCEPFYDVRKVAAALRRLPAIDKDDALRLAKSAAGAMNPARDAAVLAFENDLYFVTLAGDRALRLTSDPQREELAQFSPDGRYVAFVRDFDLCVVDVETGTSRALTTGGSTLLRHGKADWIYYEEVFGRSWRAFKWSPDSRRLAFLRFDDTPVGEFAVVDEIPAGQRLEQTRYPNPGGANPRVTLGVVTAAGGTPRWIALDDYPADATLITNFGWTPDGKRLYFYVQDRAQTWLDFMTASSNGRDARRLFRERTKAWVDNPGAPHFLADGGFLLASERDGFRRLYRFDAKGQNPRPLTTGDWETHDAQRVDEKAGWVYFTGGKDSSLGENLYRARLDGSCLTRLTSGAGAHQTQVSPAGELFVDTASDRQTPSRLALRDVSGACVRTLDTNPVAALDDYEWAPPEFVRIEARDGFTLEGALIKPKDFDPQRRYPVWFMTYGGPHAPRSATPGRAAEPTTRPWRRWGWWSFVAIRAAPAVKALAALGPRIANSAWRNCATSRTPSAGWPNCRTSTRTASA